MKWSLIACLDHSLLTQLYSVSAAAAAWSFPEFPVVWTLLVVPARGHERISDYADGFHSGGGVAGAVDDTFPTVSARTKMCNNNSIWVPAVFIKERLRQYFCYPVPSESSANLTILARVKHGDNRVGDVLVWWVAYPCISSGHLELLVMHCICWCNLEFLLPWKNIFRHDESSMIAGANFCTKWFPGRIPIVTGLLIMLVVRRVSFFVKKKNCQVKYVTLSNEAERKTKYYNENSIKYIFRNRLFDPCIVCFLQRNRFVLWLH